MIEKKNGFTREIQFSKAFDRRNPDPKKNYGVHCAEMRFLLKKKDKAVQFVLFTGWDLPHVREERSSTGKGIFTGTVMPADLGYHSPKPMYEGQTLINKEPCPYIGVPCYYDGSGLNAEQPYEVLVTEGEEALWDFLEGYYERTFESL